MQTEFNDLFDWLAHLEFFGVKLGLQQTRLLEATAKALREP